MNPKTALGVETLLDQWRGQARLAYEEERDSVSGKFASANRLQSGYHIRALTEAAERSVAAMLAKSRALPIPADCYSVARRAASVLFDDLMADVEAVAVGASGRAPKPANRVVVDRLFNEARTRIETLIAAWELEDQIRLAAFEGADVLEQKTSTRSPSFKDGRPPCDDQILAQADAMKALGLTGYEIAKEMRHKEGFQNVGTIAVRELLKGRWSGGRSRKK